uniref:Uncharacterized protein n=1 Tax=Anguilla anguilla TaxID=7936 RepID=A0A0E9QNT1_ANGAN
MFLGCTVDGQVWSISCSHLKYFPLL